MNRRAANAFNAKHGVAEGEEAVALVDGVLVGGQDVLAVLKAETSIISVERGTWKLVMSASTTWNS